MKILKAFKRYERSYRIEIIHLKDPSVQLTISKRSREDFFKASLNEIKGFKYQTTLKVLLKKYKENADREFATIYFNSTTKTVIGPKYGLKKSFQEVFNIINNWMTEGSS